MKVRASFSFVLHHSHYASCSTLDLNEANPPITFPNPCKR
jgi:hypothetical protein